MAGVRVSLLPSNLTEKHLKVYFSNPRNGGGRVKKILHPLTNNAAVITFDDDAVVETVLSRSHRLMNREIGVDPLPKQVFRQVVVEVEPKVSSFMLMNPQLVDELQFIGEVDVNLRESKQVYFLSGSWYQLEWAFHYLDTMLDTFGFEPEPATAVSAPAASRESDATRDSPVSSAILNQAQYQQPPPNEFEIKRPNIPVVNRPHETERPQRPPAPFSGQRQNTPLMSDTKPAPKRNKNKNLVPGSPASPNINNMTDPMLAGNRMFDENIKGNLNKEDEDTKPTKQIQNDFGSDSDSGDDLAQSRYRVNRPTFNPADYGGYGEYNSDSENEAMLGEVYDRRVNFSPGTNFMENKGRPRRMVNINHMAMPQMPEKTRGIDVAETNFGEVPLTFSFDVVNNIKVRVAMDDITRQTTDAIVNPASPNLLSNLSAVSRAILSASGTEVQLECRQFAEEMGDLNVAQLVHTSAGGNLNPKVGFILHVLGPQWRERDADRSTHVLICAYLNCFMYADQKLWLQSLALPLINAGAYGFPLDVCIQAFYDALLLFSSNAGPNVHLKDISLVCFDQDSAMAAIMITRSLLDCETSQASVAATDRYLTRKTNFDFAADYFVLMSDTGENDQTNAPDKTGDDNADDKADNERDTQQDKESESDDDNNVDDDDDDDDDDEETDENEDNDEKEEGGSKVMPCTLKSEDVPDDTNPVDKENEPASMLVGRKGHYARSGSYGDEDNRAINEDDGSKVKSGSLNIPRGNIKMNFSKSYGQDQFAGAAAFKPNILKTDTQSSGLDPDADVNTHDSEENMKEQTVGEGNTNRSDESDNETEKEDAASTNINPITSGEEGQLDDKQDTRLTDKDDDAIGAVCKVPTLETDKEGDDIGTTCADSPANIQEDVNDTVHEEKENFNKSTKEQVVQGCTPVSGASLDKDWSIVPDVVGSELTEKQDSGEKDNVAEETTET